MVEVVQKLGTKQAEGAWGNKDLEIVLVPRSSSSPPTLKNTWSYGIRNPSIFIYRLRLLPAVGSLGRQNRRKLVFSLYLEVGRAEPLWSLGWEAVVEPGAWSESLAGPFSSSPACSTRDGLLGTRLGPADTWSRIQVPTQHFPV